MKKIILLFICIITISLTSQAQNPPSITLEQKKNTSAALNFKNPVGFWHLSGPRSYELNNNFSVFWNNGTYKRYFTISDKGNVGVGTANPLEKFQIGNSYTFHDGGHKVIGFLYQPSSGVDLNKSRFSAEIRFDPIKGDFRLGTSSSITGNPVTHFNIDKNGRIGIGTTNPGAWKLAVNGNIRAKEIKVETGWADFVFEDNYSLPTLKEVENHIKEKGHLKDIPSANEVSKNGILLGEMNSKLLQKIEELTLYTIEQEKRINTLELSKTNLEKDNKMLKSMAERLLIIEKYINQN